MYYLLSWTERFGRGAAIAAQLQPSSPLWYHAELERPHCSGWLLTTSEVRQLIGVKPVCPSGIKTYQRGCWLFQKAGKIARSADKLLGAILKSQPTDSGT